MISSSKKDIISRLFKDGHITLDEVLALMEAEKEYVYVPLQNYPGSPLINPAPIYPQNPFWYGSGGTTDPYRGPVTLTYTVNAGTTSGISNSQN